MPDGLPSEFAALPSALKERRSQLEQFERDKDDPSRTGQSPEPDAAKAEAHFKGALTVARQQQAKSWELRAAMSMARLWRGHGKRQEAHDLLTPIYDWFTEGFDRLDLKEAKALLEKLHA